VALSRRRLRLLLLGLALPMLAIGLWMMMERRFGAAALSLGCSFLAWFGWRMSGDLDPFWLELEGDRLAVQMRRSRRVLRLKNPSWRLLEAADIAYLHGLTSVASLVFSSASFDSQRFGEVELFATDLDRAILIEVDDPEDDEARLRWILTPDDTEEFTHRLAETSSPAVTDDAAGDAREMA